MKTIMLTLSFFSLLILVSCDREETDNQFNEEKQLEIMKNDPVFLDYHRLVQNIAKLVTENENLDYDKYSEIMKTKSGEVDYCDVDKTMFNGDKEMETLVETYCKISIAGKIFNDKYPFYQKLSKKERTEFLKDPSLKFDVNIETRRKNAEKEYQKQQKENLNN